MNETALEYCREVYVDIPSFCLPPPEFQVIPMEYKGLFIVVFLLFAVACLGVAFYMIATDERLK
jgi:hypothetical protein